VRFFKPKQMEVYLEYIKFIHWLCFFFILKRIYFLPEEKVDSF